MKSPTALSASSGYHIWSWVKLASHPRGAHGGERMSGNPENEELIRALRLTALVALRGMKQREQVELLDKAGYVQKEIAQLLSTTPKAISVRLAEIRKERKAKIK
jgi:DNA-directed RNA polymerase specialized sigma24 family protein